MKNIYCVTTLLLLTLSCGNPPIKRELVRYTEKKKNHVHQSRLLVFEKKDFYIYLEPISAFEMEELADMLNLYSEQKIYRIPGLSYFKFRIINNSKTPVEFNLFELFFKDEFNEKYSPLKLDEYYEKYTSVSYDKFNFDFMYSFYLTKKSGVEKEYNKEFYFSKILPENTVKIPPDSEGFQIVPFRFFSPGSRKYTLVFSSDPFFNGRTEVFYYRPRRADKDED